MASPYREFFWGLNAPQEALREALLAEGLPFESFVNRAPIFSDEVDGEFVKAVAIAVKDGSWKPPKAKKRKRK
jgi:hypothetical protein